jgi:hypothetical protein
MHPCIPREQPPTTVESAANIVLWDVMPASGNTRSNARHSEVRRWKLDEMEHRPEPKLELASKRGLTGAVRTRDEDGGRCSHPDVAGTIRPESYSVDRTVGKEGVTGCDDARPSASTAC